MIVTYEQFAAQTPPVSYGSRAIPNVRFVFGLVPNSVAKCLFIFDRAPKADSCIGL